MADSLTHRSIIDLWPSLREFAEDIGVEYGTAKQMRRRDSIDRPHWPAVLAGAARRGFDGVTLEALAGIRADGMAEAR